MPMESPRSNGSPETLASTHRGPATLEIDFDEAALCGGLNFLPPERAGRPGAPFLKRERADDIKRAHGAFHAR